MIDSPGLTARLFFESLSDQELRQFLDPEILSALDAIFGGRVVGEDLRNVVMTLVDVGKLLGEEKGRQFILNLVPQRKRAELESRVQTEIYNVTTTDWTEAEVKRLRDFFGIIDDKIVSVAPPDAYRSRT